MYSATGKQVLRDGKHFADAVSSTAALEIVAAMNAYDQSRYSADDPDLFDTQIEWVALDKGHVVRRENDEYVCSCGKRWDASEGDEHP